MEWVEELIQRLEKATNGILEIEIGGKKVVAQIGNDLIIFFKQNKDLLTRVGKETFRSFLILVNEKKNEEAFNLLLDKMTADDIILRMEMNASELCKLNELKEKFIVSLNKFLLNTLLPTTAKLLIAILI
jgi:hypothetical protein